MHGWSCTRVFPAVYSAQTEFGNRGEAADRKTRMAKFKFHIKLQGLEVSMEGDRADIPMMASNAAQRFAGILEPAMNVAADELPPKKVENTAAAFNGLTEPKPPPRRKSRSAANAGPVGATKFVDWKHDPDKWGNPLQGWSTTEKCIWLIHVAEQAASVKEMTNPQIIATFNKHFRQAGQLNRGNVHRDLGKAKSGAGALIGENTSVNPPAWFLTTTGKTKGAVLVDQALNPATAS